MKIQSVIGVVSAGSLVLAAGCLPVDIAWYLDADGDGYGDPGNVIVTNVQPEGYVSDNNDCDDSDANINPGVADVDIGDDVDNDCNGAVNEDSARFVFMTSAAFDDNMGGLTGADALCQNAADNSGNPVLAGKIFKAWLSDTTTNVRDRINFTNQMAYVSYVAEGPAVVTVANKWLTLTNDDPLAPELHDELGAPAATQAWSGSNNRGARVVNNFGYDVTEYSNVFCNDWNFNGAHTAGEPGGLYLDTEVSLKSVGVVECATALPLVCLQQAE